MLIGKFKFFYLMSLIALSIPNVACAKKNEVLCDTSNIEESIQCVKRENATLSNKLELLSNDERTDYSIWMQDIKNKCEGKKSYTLGEGAALIREQCYKEEYIDRLENISIKKNISKIDVKKKNEDGLLVTTLPYNSDDHINCLLNNNKNSCNRVNLIDTPDLLKVYNFIDESFGPSVVFPETTNGVLLIASPSTSDSGSPLINLTSVNLLGLTNKISLDASKNIFINENGEISYLKNAKPIKIILNKNGEFVK